MWVLSYNGPSNEVDGYWKFAVTRSFFCVIVATKVPKIYWKEMLWSMWMPLLSQFEINHLVSSHVMLPMTCVAVLMWACDICQIIIGIPASCIVWNYLNPNILTILLCCIHAENPVMFCSQHYVKNVFNSQESFTTVLMVLSESMWRISHQIRKMMDMMICILWIELIWFSPHATRI